LLHSTRTCVLTCSSAIDLYCPLSTSLSHLPSFFFLMIPPPPTSTLFPYTTLFRSRQRRIVERQRIVRADVIDGVRRSISRGAARDRKSTRLNSSHQIISYAVFCLKKKKKRKTKDKSNT